MVISISICNWRVNYLLQSRDGPPAQQINMHNIKLGFQTLPATRKIPTIIFKINPIHSITPSRLATYLMNGANDRVQPSLVFPHSYLNPIEFKCKPFYVSWSSFHSLSSPIIILNENQDSTKDQPQQFCHMSSYFFVLYSTKGHQIFLLRKRAISIPMEALVKLCSIILAFLSFSLAFSTSTRTCSSKKCEQYFTSVFCSMCKAILGFQSFLRVLKCLYVQEFPLIFFTGSGTCLTWWQYLA